MGQISDFVKRSKSLGSVSFFGSFPIIHHLLARIAAQAYCMHVRDERKRAAKKIKDQ
jgi:hypothetical protein